MCGEFGQPAGFIGFALLLRFAFARLSDAAGFLLRCYFSKPARLSSLPLFFRLTLALTLLSHTAGLGCLASFFCLGFRFRALDVPQALFLREAALLGFRARPRQHLFLIGFALSLCYPVGFSLLLSLAFRIGLFAFCRWRLR